jgi:hypothetical protein
MILSGVLTLLLQVSAQPLEQASPNTLRLTLRLAKERFHENEPIAIAIDVTNKGVGDEIALLVPHLYLGSSRGATNPYLQLDLAVLDGDGHRVPAGSQMDDQTETSPFILPGCGFEALGAGEHFGRTISLSDGPLRLPRLRRGVYRLRGTLRSLARAWLQEMDDSKRPAWIPDSQMKYVFQGALESPEIVFRIQ